MMIIYKLSKIIKTKFTSKAKSNILKAIIIPSEV